MTATITDKIRKLLARAERTSSEHERDTAVQMAQKLATKHQIDMAKLVQDGDTSDETAEVFIQIGGHGQHGKRALVDLYIGIGHTNGLDVGIGPNRRFVRLIGYKSDIELTQLLFESLVGQMAHATEAYLSTRDRTEIAYSEQYGDYRPVSTQTARKSFHEEFAKRVSLRLWRARKSGAAEYDDDHTATGAESAELVLANKSARVSAYKHEILGGATERSYRPDRRGPSSRQARIAGRSAAESARLETTGQIGGA